jgi:hypothetical protein
MSRAVHALLGVGCLLSFGCVDPGQHHVELPLFVAGSEGSRQVIARGDIPVTLDEAKLAFGPLYLCAGFQAGELCDTARLEWLGSSVVDALSPQPVLIGRLHGVTGAVRSYMYDLGISSQLTRAEPFMLDAATELGGVSVRIAGRAQLGELEVPFVALIPIQQSSQTERGVPVVRKGSNQAFFHEVERSEAGLLLSFNPAPWVAGVDFRPLFSDAEGGATELELHPESEAFRSIRNAVVLEGRPQFGWGFLP